MDGKGREGFGGRVMDDSTPKYLNSPESAIFEKGNYYLPLIRLITIRQGTTSHILVEGYMDVIPRP